MAAGGWDASAKTGRVFQVCSRAPRRRGAALVCVSRFDSPRAMTEPEWRRCQRVIARLPALLPRLAEGHPRTVTAPPRRANRLASRDADIGQLSSGPTGAAAASAPIFAETKKAVRQRATCPCIAQCFSSSLKTILRQVSEEVEEGRRNRQRLRDAGAARCSRYRFTNRKPKHY